MGNRVWTGVWGGTGVRYLGEGLGEDVRPRK